MSKNYDGLLNKAFELSEGATQEELMHMQTDALSSIMIVCSQMLETLREIEKKL